MDNEFKRLIVIAVAILTGAAGLLLLPLMKLRIAQRPASVPSTALYATGRTKNYWIDCPNIEPDPRPSLPGMDGCTSIFPVDFVPLSLASSNHGGQILFQQETLPDKAFRGFGKFLQVLFARGVALCDRKPGIA